MDLDRIFPEPSDEEAAAIVAAVEVGVAPGGGPGRAGSAVGSLWR